ncbi:hypothetical protein D3C86_1822380 [compost metagenome]
MPLRVSFEQRARAVRRGIVGKYHLKCKEAALRQDAIQALRQVLRVIVRRDEHADPAMPRQ